VAARAAHTGRTVCAHPYGHIFVFVRRVPQTATEGGLLRGCDRSQRREYLAKHSEVIAMPEGAAIFETDGPWEDYATRHPTSDC
jgi:hypothetical protein